MFFSHIFLPSHMTLLLLHLFSLMSLSPTFSPPFVNLLHHFFLCHFLLSFLANTNTLFSPSMSFLFLVSIPFSWALPSFLPHYLSSMLHNTSMLLERLCLSLSSSITFILPYFFLVRKVNRRTFFYFLHFRGSYFFSFSSFFFAFYFYFIFPSPLSIFYNHSLILPSLQSFLSLLELNIKK